MAVMKGGELIAEYLVRQKVPYIFGICGHGNVGILDPLHAVRDKLKLVSPRHEQCAGHMDWDLVPGSKMTNANLQAAVAAAGGNEITLKYKDGEQKIMVPNGTPIIGFDNGDRSALKKGETIWTNARVEGDGKLVTNRVQVSKGGVKPEH